MSIESPGRMAARLMIANSYADASRLAETVANSERGVYVIHASSGSGKSQTMAWLLREEFIRPEVRSRLRNASDLLRAALTRSERYLAVREFLGALTELVLILACFFAGVALLLLSCSTGRIVVDADAPWKPPPLTRTPQITPRGPNPAFPVNKHRGGHYRSALGSVVLAA